MSTDLALNFAAPIPVGHTVEITEFEDTRPEKKRKGMGWSEAFRHPAVQDLDTGIRYLNHVHVSWGGNGGNVFEPNRYAFTPRRELPVARTWRARVVACTVVNVEGLATQHTMLALDPL
jgi:hypothetical protein